MERGIFGSPPVFFFHLWPLDLDLEIFALGLDLDPEIFDLDLDLDIFVLDLDPEIFDLDLAILEDVVNSADPLLCISAYSTGF